MLKSDWIEWTLLTLNHHIVIYCYVTDHLGYVDTEWACTTQSDWFQTDELDNLDVDVYTYFIISRLIYTHVEQSQWNK